MTIFIENSEVVTVLQTAMAPAFLLLGIGGMLTIFTDRLARIIDRSRILQDGFAEAKGAELEMIVHELRELQQRIKRVNSAIYLSVMSAVVVCALIVLLFAMRLTNEPQLAMIIAGAFILAVILLSVALIQFLREVRTGIKILALPDHYLNIPSVSDSAVSDTADM